MFTNGCGQKTREVRSFEKGLAARGGWREEFPPPHTLSSGLFSAPFSLCPLISRRTQFWAGFSCCILGKKAAGVSGRLSGVPEEISGKTTGNSLEISPRIAKCFIFEAFGHWGNAKLPRTLGRHCPRPCPHPLCGVCLFNRRPKSIHQHCAKESPTTTLKALWCVYVFSCVFPLKTSFLVYTKPLFCLLRNLNFQS